MRDVTHLFRANAFVGPEAAGNPTCVVIEDVELSERDRHDIARELAVPDTAFVYRTRAVEPWSVRFYSPDEGEMSFCGQGLIAVDAVLREVAHAPRDTPITLVTRIGVVRTRSAANTHWFDVPRDRIRRCDGDISPATLAKALTDATPAPVVDSGRRRLFHRCHDGASLNAIGIAPAAVVAFCGTHNLTGLCFYTLLDRNRIALRVFTISLSGREDASTGGAVLGLSVLLPPGEWMIDQGSGGRASRGLLLLDSSSLEGEISVGGRVEVEGV